MSEPLLIGPFTTYPVVVDGRIIPRLTGHPLPYGGYELIVDGRFSASFPDEETARSAAWLIAEATAVAEGYSHLEALTKGRPFAPEVHQLSQVPGGTDV